MAYTAAAIYGIAGLDGAIEGLLPSDPPFAMLPVVVVFVMFALLMAVRSPAAPVGTGAAGTARGGVDRLRAGRPARAPATAPCSTPCRCSGPRSSSAAGEPAVILVCVAAGHAVTLLLLPAADAYPGSLARRDGVGVRRRARRTRPRAPQRDAGRAARRRGEDRSADRPAQPARVRRARRAGVRPRGPHDGSRSHWPRWTSTTSSRSTTSGGTSSETGCSPPGAGAGGARRGSSTWRRAWAARSSRCSCRAATRQERRRSSSACAPVSRLRPAPTCRPCASAPAWWRPASRVDVQVMLERVDRALYAAKRGGRDRTVVFGRHDFPLAA